MSKITIDKKPRSSLGCTLAGTRATSRGSQFIHMPIILPLPTLPFPICDFGFPILDCQSKQPKTLSKMFRSLRISLALHPRLKGEDRGEGMCLRFLHKALEVAQHLVRIELDAHVLHAQYATLIDKRGEERVIHIAARRFLVIDAVTLGDIADLGLCTGQERPAGRVCLVCFGIALEHLRRVAFRVHRDRKEIDLRTEVRAEASL